MALSRQASSWVVQKFSSAGSRTSKETAIRSGADGQFMNLQLTKDSNIVCISGSDAKLMTGRHDMQEHAEIPISPEQMNRHDPNRLDEQLNLLNDPIANRRNTKRLPHLKTLQR
jgi:hypothetical protein